MRRQQGSAAGGERTTAPFGAWESPFPISLLTDGVVGLGEVRASGGVRWWLEGRPDEGGRQVLFRRDPDGTVTRLTPPGFNCRVACASDFHGAACGPGFVSLPRVASTKSFRKNPRGSTQIRAGLTQGRARTACGGEGLQASFRPLAGALGDGKSLRQLGANS